MRLLLILLVSSQSFSTFALTLDDVLKSTAKSYPLILESLEKRNMAQGKLQASEGIFDLSINGKADHRFRGFYDGESFDLTLNKPMSFLNSEVYLGYKKSNGLYPGYEGKVETLTQGETRAGIKFSLWKNRDIDIRRLKVIKNKINLSSAEFAILETRVKVQKLAIQTYRKWIASLKILKTYKELLSIAQKRDSALKRRVKQGDLAKIYRTENQQYILKWKRSLLESQNTFKQVSIDLSLFYRSSDGRPIVLGEKEISLDKNSQIKISKQELEQDLASSISINPKLRILNNKIQSLSFEEEIGKNSLRPKLDLKLEMSRDQGNGSGTLRETENRAWLSLNIPIQTNTAKGKMRAAQANKKQLFFKRKLIIEKMSAELEKIMNSINLAIEITKNTKTEIELAKKLRSAEYKKFSKGDSDFFVLNIREQNLASAQIQNVKAEFDYYYSLAEYEARTFKLLRTGIDS